ncbi:F protein [Mount Mabu Lophuromys virus 2]|uniref:Fusion glycoprotein F0 n=1 Tax=Mount Mabu Lophuromys virus 2 TaxID=2116560 RepID=A0A2P1GJ86_9MONO|nr:F protein [Mount Mabu Lophuromys virus 2]AVM86024.1 F protein [Mount Mabu Lophuromys virus 2]
MTKLYYISIIIVVIAINLHYIEAQISLAELSKIGIIQGNNYGLKVSGVSTYQLMVIKLIPNVSQLSNCTTDVMVSYKGMLDRILNPINSSLAKVRAAIKDKVDYTPSRNGERFWGAIVGGVALGVATAAQVTAGVALHNSLENAKAIMQLKDAIRNSNAAIQELTTSQGQVVVAINALQEQINTQLVPSLNQLGCSVIGNTLGLKLNQYFSELSLIFGPNLRDPTSETLSIQAIARAFNGDFDTMLNKLKYDTSDFLDLLESGGIRGRIIDVSLTDYIISLQIEYPTLTAIPDATVQLFNLISYNHRGSEWMSVFPRQMLIRGSYLSNIDLSECVQTSSNYICSTDTSSALSSGTYECATGNITSCARTRVVNSHVSRFALSKGVLFVNCASIVCRCQDPKYTIIQDTQVTNVMISSQDCKEVYIDGYFITLGPKTLERSMYSDNVTLGGTVSVEIIDIGNELNSIQESLNRTQHYIDKSNEILDRVNPNVINLGTIGGIMFLTILATIWFIISLIWLICLTRKIMIPRSNLTTSSRSSTVNSLAGFIN